MKGSKRRALVRGALGLGAVAMVAGCGMSTPLGLSEALIAEEPVASEEIPPPPKEMPPPSEIEPVEVKPQPVEEGTVKPEPEPGTVWTMSPGEPKEPPPPPEMEPVEERPVPNKEAASPPEADPEIVYATGAPTPTRRNGKAGMNLGQRIREAIATAREAGSGIATGRRLGQVARDLATGQSTGKRQ